MNILRERLIDMVWIFGATAIIIFLSGWIVEMLIDLKKMIKKD